MLRCWSEPAPWSHPDPTASWQRSQPLQSGRQRPASVGSQGTLSACLQHSSQPAWALRAHCQHACNTEASQRGLSGHTASIKEASQGPERHPGCSGSRIPAVTQAIVGGTVPEQEEAQGAQGPEFQLSQRLANSEACSIRTLFRGQKAVWHACIHPAITAPVFSGLLLPTRLPRLQACAGTWRLATQAGSGAGHSLDLSLP